MALATYLFKRINPIFLFFTPPLLKSSDYSFLSASLSGVTPDSFSSLTFFLAGNPKINPISAPYKVVKYQLDVIGQEPLRHPTK